MFERAVIQEVRRKTDFVALVQEYRPLKKQGSRWVGCCPFHGEKTPSFNVSPDVQLAVCFGCKWGGDVIRFVEHLEGLTFPEALRFLAERAGIDLPETRDPAVVAEDRRQRDQRQRLYAACEAAAAFYEAQLVSAPFSELARGAIEERNVSPDTAALFRLGYAPARWDGLAEHLRRQGVSPADAESAGLLLPSRSGRGHHDRFRHRLMFPVTDRSGRVVAFSGRALPMTEDLPEGVVPPESGKYINSPETDIFTKGEHLYGLRPARDALVRSGHAVLVEGNFDVVQMHQHGFCEAVAPLGTAFTPEQGTLLRRLADRVTLLFDGDGAGRRAARASHAVCEGAGLPARVGVLPRGTDPDAFLRARGRAAMEGVLRTAPGMVEWIIRDVASQLGGEAGATVTASDRVAAARELAPVLAGVRDAIERREAVREAARLLLLSEDGVTQALSDHLRRAQDEERAPLPTVRMHADRPGLGVLGSAGDTSEGAARRAMAVGVEAVLYDRSLLPGDLAGRLEEHLRPPFDGVLREARAQWGRFEQLDGPTLLELVPEEPRGAREWFAARLIPQQDEAVLARCGMALRDAVGRLDRCREAAGAEARRAEGMRLGARGDRVSEVDVLERQREAAREAAAGREALRASLGRKRGTGPATHGGGSLN